MSDLIRQLCVLSIFCGVALNLTPEGNVRRVVSIVCSAALICAALGLVGKLEEGGYALEMSRLQEREQELENRSGDFSDRLNRLVIVGQYESYIMYKAAHRSL